MGRCEGRSRLGAANREANGLAKLPIHRRQLSRASTHLSFAALTDFLRCSSSACGCSQIMESSQTLLHVLKRESVNLTKKKQASS